MDEHADRYLQILQLHADIASLLARPSCVWVAGTGTEDQPPTPELHEYKDLDDIEQHAMDGEEVAGQHRVGLSAQELTPAETTAPRCGSNTMPAQEQPDG